MSEWELQYPMSKLHCRTFAEGKAERVASRTEAGQMSDLPPDPYIISGEELEHLRSRIGALEAALRKVRSYNVDIDAGRINYRPHDHIQVIDAALAPEQDK